MVLTAPYSPVDGLRDLVDAVQSLQSTQTSDCCWFQEPGELHWSLRRSDKELVLEILSFPDINYPGHHRGEGVSVFKAGTKWLTFASQLLVSLQSIKTNLGLEGYERAWRHPFPKEAYEKLQSAIQNET